MRAPTLSLLGALVLAGCGSDSPSPTPNLGDDRLEGELTLELRDTVAVTITPGGPTELDGPASFRLEPSADFGLLGSEPLEAEGRIEQLPEAHSTLYTAKLNVAAQSGGPCGSEPVSVALTLHRQGQNAIVVGGLTAYCGENRWYAAKGEAPVRVLRLAGDLPLK